MNSVSVLTNVHPPYDQRVFHKQAKSLRDAGYDVSITAPIDSPETRDGIDILPIGNHKSRPERWKHLPQLYRMARSQDADIYHLHDPELLPIGIALSHRTDGQVVYDVHEDFSVALQHRDWVPSAVSPLATGTISRIQAELAKRVDAVITATEWIEETFVKYGLKNCVTVRNFPKIDDIDEQPVKVDFPYETTLAYVGGLSERRGLLRMLNLLDGLVDEGYDMGLCLIGPFNDPNAEESIERFSREHSLEDRIQLTGYLDYADVFKYLRGADIGLVLASPDVYKCVISTKMFEYMYSELPIIATDIDSVAKYLPADAGFLVDPDNFREQATAVRTVVDNARIRAHMGTRGREAVEQHYSWSVEERRLLQLYSRLIS